MVNTIQAQAIYDKYQYRGFLHEHLELDWEVSAFNIECGYHQTTLMRAAFEDLIRDNDDRAEADQLLLTYKFPQKWIDSL